MYIIFFSISWMFYTLHGLFVNCYHSFNLLICIFLQWRRSILQVTCTLRNPLHKIGVKLLSFYRYVAHAVQMGSSKESASFLLSIIGISSTFGRIFLGWLSDHPKVIMKLLFLNLKYIFSCNFIKVLQLTGQRIAFKQYFVDVLRHFDYLMPIFYFLWSTRRILSPARNKHF